MYNLSLFVLPPSPKVMSLGIIDAPLLSPEDKSVQNIAYQKSVNASVYKRRFFELIQHTIKLLCIVLCYKQHWKNTCTLESERDQITSDLTTSVRSLHKAYPRHSMITRTSSLAVVQLCYSSSSGQAFQFGDVVVWLSKECPITIRPVSTRSCREKHRSG